MKNKLEGIFFLTLLVVLLFGCGSSNSDKGAKKEITNEIIKTFHYKIEMNIQGSKGPITLIDRINLLPIQTIYPDKVKYTIEGDLPLSKLHNSYIIHFPCIFPDPTIYPPSEVCSIYFDMDRDNKIVGDYNSLFNVKVENKFISDVQKFEEKNLPATVAFEKYKLNYVTKFDRKNYNKKDLQAYFDKGDSLFDAMKKEIILKVQYFEDSEEMAKVLSNYADKIMSWKLDSLSHLFTSRVQCSSSYKQILKIISSQMNFMKSENLVVGEKAPLFVLPDALGKFHSLSDYKGKYLIIDFWASWNTSCLKEIPFMKRIYKKYHKKGLEMLSISLDYTKDKWLETKSNMNMPYLQLYDEYGKVADDYRVRGIPFVILIDPAGLILGIEKGKRLENLLNIAL